MYYYELGFDQYEEYLESEHWQKLRREYWKIAKEKKCRICSTTRSLVLHHRSYENLGQENIKRDLVILCQDCHELVHFDGKFKTPLKRKYLVARENELCKKYHTWYYRIYRLKPNDVFSFFYGLYAIQSNSR